MIRSELATRLADRFPQLVRADADLAVGLILEAIGNALARGGRVEIRSFGLSYRPPRQARNPKTGAAVLVPGKRLPHFRAGKVMRGRIADSVAQSARLRRAA